MHGSLIILFNKLAKYLSIPATFIFVFDGPERPKIKRSHEVRTAVLRWTQTVQNLVRYFGYHVHQASTSVFAPGEAEAELAMLNRLGRVDAVITSDSDSLVFGARTVLRSVPHKDKQTADEIKVFTSDAVRDRLNLTYEGLVLFALLAGGDYDPTGVIGCGSQTSLGLAQCGFGERLIEARSSGSPFLSILDISNWRAELKLEIATNSQKKLSRRQPQLATQVSDTFPDHQIMDLYTHPCVSSPEHLPSHWLIHQPSLCNLTNFCRERFDWDDDYILEVFKSRIWEGAFLQMLYSVRMAGLVEFY
ncbi:PIN domain-like protein [Pholiota conissans]|uniref:PIN domain-like protein n=1 Tax=Pholiota conissans TaxID=109636 RepID=A0A9P6CW77_9AGAR|nr:PIN domain-like protein [Pholiota conissans]